MQILYKNNIPHPNLWFDFRAGLFIEQLLIKNYLNIIKIISKFFIFSDKSLIF